MAARRQEDMRVRWVSDREELIENILSTFYKKKQWLARMGVQNLMIIL